MTDPVRFPAQVPYDKWPFAGDVFAAIVAGDWTLAKSRYDANPQQVSDAMGAVQYWYAQFAPPTDPLAGFRARQAVSQNCAWVNVTPAENGALGALYGPGLVNQYNNFYTVGGSGGLGVTEQPRADSPSGWSFVGANQAWTHDVNQAADAYVATMAAAQGRTVPPPI